jgi:hypothetical protein
MAIVGVRIWTCGNVFEYYLPESQKIKTHATAEEVLQIEEYGKAIIIKGRPMLGEDHIVFNKELANIYVFEFKELA